MTPTTEDVLSTHEVQTIIETAAMRLSTYEAFARDVESAVLQKLQRHDIEGLIDRAYIEFDAMRSGTGEFQGQAWDECDAFKAHMRRFAYARYHELIGQVLKANRGTSS
ncbi:hypothetical protein [Castellaniella sp.]|uniref:hypothetical protein n=1 Tax=Castellaniella sp. TaxID=1955812 RepID=UPI002AFE3E0A|nr:hypothetical protein [Castellaniella sp.]